ncbi:Panacea domain-containing protein [Corynebacterium glutamicum]|uniref:Panacea domain-containing protein n=1 Tax=Corynebacterium glutamicum TaxID=1718 RepID=UPI001B8D76C2|nr:type II toxin-antitoxin system antitoxin SocA domain-containing protein [Corynebacterium glutamicum]
MAIKASDLAKYLLTLGESEMTTMKLQKLVYYCQAYRLAWTGEPMFKEQIRAWTHGPVVYELFTQHKGKFSISADDIEGDATQVKNEDKIVADAVYATFKSLTGWELRERTHAEDPWKNHFSDSDARHNREIPHSAMQSFYSVEE